MSSEGLPAAPRAPRLQRGLAVACALVYLGLALHTAASKSETYDEPLTILAGWSYVQTGDFSFNREHPPLAKLLMGLALLPLDPVLPPDYQVLPAPALVFLSRQPELTPGEILFAARLPGVLLGLLLLLYAWRWAAIAFGPTAAVAAVALLALNPNLIGHAAVAGNDFALGVFSFAAAYHAWRWLASGCRGSLALLGLTLGLALGTKLTALLLLPVLGVTVLGAAIARRRPALLLQGVLALLAAGGVLWLLYLGEARSLEDARVHARFIPRGGEAGTVFGELPIEGPLEALFGVSTPIPLLGFLKAVDHQFFHAEHGHQSFFWGKAGAEGHPGYFLATGAIKNPVGLVLLILAGLAGLIAGRRTARGWLHETWLHGFTLLMLVVFSRSDVQLGFKYMLPAVPFLALMGARIFAAGHDGLAARVGRGEALAVAATLAAGGAGLSLLFREPGPLTLLDALPAVLGLLVAFAVALAARGGRVDLRPAAAALVAWASLEALANHPHHLAFFNGWAGGGDAGTFYSVVGDDWGQDTALLGEWMAEQGLDEIFYDYYGTADPERWGVRHRPGWLGLEPRSEGLLAVHVSLLRRLPEAFAALAEQQPVAVLGHTIQVFDLAQLAARP